MRIIIAPDSFKGTLSSCQVIAIVERAALSHFPRAEIVRVPMADGGEGTVESLVIAMGGEYRDCRVQDPLGRPVTARYGIIQGETAVLEMAQASGLPLLKLVDLNPMIASSYGTGQMMKDALDQGIRHFIVGIGGSATNDGGTGLLQALGLKFLDAGGKEVGKGGQVLARIAAFDPSGLDARLAGSEITVICDVSNPLTGPQGATYIYGPQKGAQGGTLTQLEMGMENYRQLILKKLGKDMNQIPGSGAVGGLGAALVSFLGGVLKPGVETILDLVQFNKLLDQTDLVITGEGRIDGQTAFGKVPVGVAKRCKAKKVPVLAISGTASQDAGIIYDYGIDAYISCINREMTLEEAMQQAAPLLEEAADGMFRIINTGIKLAPKEKTLDSGG